MQIIPKSGHENMAYHILPTLHNQIWFNVSSTCRFECTFIKNGRPNLQGLLLLTLGQGETFLEMNASYPASIFELMFINFVYFNSCWFLHLLAFGNSHWLNTATEPGRNPAWPCSNVNHSHATKWEAPINANTWQKLQDI